MEIPDFSEKCTNGDLSCIVGMAFVVGGLFWQEISMISMPLDDYTYLQIRKLSYFVVHIQHGYLPP